MKPLTSVRIREMKAEGTPVVMVTAYDHLMASLVDQAGLDMILVGDSVGMVVQGRPTTLGVTLDEMIYHTRCVTARPRRALVVGDLPFGSYQASSAQAVRSACRLMSEGGAGAVKLEGGEEYADRVAAIVDAGIPVMGHVGLTPQSIHRFGGYKVQGRDEVRAQEILRGAQALQEAGAFSVVLEKVTEEVAKEVTGVLDVPTVGIGAGRYTDGQVLVMQDLLGLFEEFRPKFVKRYASMAQDCRDALERYGAEVRDRTFPGPEHVYRSEAAEDTARKVVAPGGTTSGADPGDSNT